MLDTINKMIRSINRWYVSKAMIAMDFTKPLKITSVKGFKQYYDSSEYVSNGYLDLFTRWLARPNEHLYDDQIHTDQLLAEGMDHRDMNGVLGAMALRVYCRVTSCLGYDTVYDTEDEFVRDVIGLRERYSNMKWLPNAASIEYLCTNFDVFDIIRRAPTSLHHHFVVDTLFMNECEYKSGTLPVGGRAFLLLTKEGFVLESLEMDGKECDTDADPDGVRRFLQGLFTCITVRSHMNSHILSAKMTSANIAHLPPDSVLRHILRPTEIGTRNIMANGLSFLLMPDGAFHTIGPFTFAGLRQLTTFRHIYDLTLDVDELKCPPFQGRNTWQVYIDTFADRIVPTDITSYQRWARACGCDDILITRASVVQLVSQAYMNQIHHNTFSNGLFSDMVLDMSSKSTRTQVLLTLLTTSRTSLDWFKLTTDMSDLAKSHPYAAKVWREFYTGLNDISISKYTPLLHAKEMEASTGM